MFEQIKRLARHSAVYGISDALNRSIGFLLMFLYTRRLTNDEIGLYVLGYVFAGFFGIFYSWGLSNAFLRYVVTVDRKEEQRVLFSTSYLFLFMLSLSLSTLLWIFPDSISRLAFGGGGYPDLIRLIGGILFFDTLCTLPFLVLRAQERSGTYLLLYVLKFFLTIGSTLVLVGWADRGVRGVFESNLIASGVLFGASFRYGLPYLRSLFALGRLKSLLAFGVPYVPTLLANRVIELSDRRILEWMTDTDVVGLYTVGYRFGMIVLFFVKAFEIAWQPFFLSISREAEAKKVYARVMTYFLLIGSLLFLLICFLIPLLFPVYAPKQPTASRVVPLIALSYLLYGLYVNLIVGVYLKNRTRVLPSIVGVAAAVNIFLNLVLIPQYGMMGAAAATLAAYAVMAALLHEILRRSYPIRYEWIRILKILLITGVIYGAGVLLQREQLILDTLLKLGLMGLYGMLLFFIGFFEEREIVYIRGWLRRCKDSSVKDGETE
jgi:O-antigen/teichoic acid export membrane protein